MCGIAGYWSTVRPPRETLAVLTDMLAHRGPDGFGYLSAMDGQVGLGHRRLAIIDPGQNSQQPMISADRRYALVFNGEIFNFLEIREELRRLGRQFRTDSDTEVLLTAFAEWGPDCLNRLNGMWAFALWDDAQRTLFLARDRFGVKPLFLLQTPTGWAFASEPKAFAALPWSGGGGAGNPSVDYLKSVTQLAPGCHATLRGATAPLTTTTWWQPLQHITIETAPAQEQVERFRDLFFDACRIRLRSDVNVGTAISGGLDSSAVLAAIHALAPDTVARRPSDWARAFHAWIPGTDHDELDYATAACERVGVKPVLIEVLQRCQVNDVAEYLYRTEGMPLTNLPAWYLYRSMREHDIRVSLDGQGADEILCGYASDAVRALMLEGSWLRRPARTLDLVRTTRDLLQGSPYYEMGGWELYVIPFGVPDWMARRHRQLRFIVPAYQGSSEMVEAARTLPPMNAIRFLAVNQGIRSLLTRYDVLSMSSGLEIRMPFMDWRLVSYALSLPSESVVGDGFAKRILREAMSAYLPDKILRRKPKLQFQGPVANVLTGPLKPWVDEMPAFRPEVEAAQRANASHRRWRQIGARIVDAWMATKFPGMVADEVRRLRRQHLADPGLAARYTATLS